MVILKHVEPPLEIRPYPAGVGQTDHGCHANVAFENVEPIPLDSSRAKDSDAVREAYQLRHA